MFHLCKALAMAHSSHSPHHRWVSFEARSVALFAALAISAAGAVQQTGPTRQQASSAAPSTQASTASQASERHASRRMAQPRG